MNSHMHHHHSPTKRHQPLIPPRSATGGSSILKTRIAKNSATNSSALLLRKQQQLQAADAAGEKLPWGGKTPKQVHRRNERERRRVQAVNRGYEHLAEMLIDWEALKHKKLTKAQTLNTAILYIEHLQRLLKVDAAAALPTAPDLAPSTGHASHSASSHSCSPDSAAHLPPTMSYGIVNDVKCSPDSTPQLPPAYELSANEVKYFSIQGSSHDSTHQPHYFSPAENKPMASQQQGYGRYCSNGQYGSAGPTAVLDTPYEASYRAGMEKSLHVRPYNTPDIGRQSERYNSNLSYTICGPYSFAPHAYNH